MNLKKTTFYSIALLIGGCLPTSLHPLYTDETLIFREELVGKWIADDGNIWQFRGGGTEEYELRICEDEQEIGGFVAHLIEIDGLMFLDLFPDPEPLDETNDFYQIHVLGVHTFMKVDQIEPHLRLRVMNNEKVVELLESDPNRLRHEMVEERLVLTAEPEELQKFVCEYVEAIFTGEPDDTDYPLDLTRLEPLYTDEDIMFDANLIGLWEATDGVMLDSQKSGENAYDLRFVEDDGTVYQSYANRVTCGDAVLMAVFADETELRPSERFHLIPDWFWRVERTGTELKLEEVEYEEVSRMMGNKNLPPKSQKKEASCRFKGTRIEQ